VSFLSFLSFQPCGSTYWKDRKDREDINFLFHVSLAGPLATQKIVPSKIRHSGGKRLNAMDNTRELASLLRRASRVSLQAPPTLHLAVLQPGDELPAPSPWRLTVAIEPKRVVQGNHRDFR